MSKQANHSYDIVIAGGGMVGTSLALALAPLGLKIAVVEAVPRAEDAQPSFDDRSTALSRSSQRMFEAMGLWDRVEAAATPITHIHVSDRGHFGFARIDAEEQGVEALGHVVINRVLGSVLQAALDGAGNVDVHCPARIVDRRGAHDSVTVIVDADGKLLELDASLLVAADGANSAVRDILGIGADRVDYGQRAVIGNLEPEFALRRRAFERFTKEGPLAILPIAEGRAAFVWNVSEGDADRILELDDDAFLGELQSMFGNRLGTFSRVGKRASYPLALTKALRLTAPRAVLVGNAAHGLHPAAAQGFNLGLRDVAALCDCIADARAEGASDLGGPALLDGYAAWRRSDQQKLVHFTDGLVRLFGDSRTPVRGLRNLGMIAFDLVPGIRKTFAKHTMGLAGRLPRLSRGVPLP